MDHREADPHETVPEEAHPEAEAAGPPPHHPEDHHLEALHPEDRHPETNPDRALPLILEEEEMDPRRDPVLDETIVIEGGTPEVHTDPIPNRSALSNPHNRPSRTPLKPSAS